MPGVKYTFVWGEHFYAEIEVRIHIIIGRTPHTLYRVTINNGSGDGTYAEGATVTITADSSASGKVNGGIALASSTSESTTFTMPAGAVEVTATYEDVATQTETYVIKSGANGIHQMGKNGTLTIICSGLEHWRI